MSGEPTERASNGAPPYGASPAGAAEPKGRLRLEGEVILFGFPKLPVGVTVRARPVGWRAAGAARNMAISVLAAAVVVVVPPHVPWALGALGTGSLLAWRRWSEKLTLERIEGTCPKCGADLAVKSSRLRTPHPISCEGCHHESALRLPADVLSAAEGSAGA